MITLRNSLQPVNRLHCEIIALCAAFVSNNDPRQIISLTHVCRYWRKAITSSPGIWAFVNTRWKGLIPLCLKRSAEVPLAVRLSVPDIEGDKRFLKTLVPHLPRISNLSLIGFSSVEDLIDDLPGFFGSKTRKLRVTALELEQTWEQIEWFPSNRTPRPPLFRNISKLKSLHLTQIPFYPALYRLPALIELKLVGYRSIPFKKFIEFLGSNGALETVVLDLGFVGAASPVAPEVKASLPRLRRLAFTCASAGDARGLLSCVTLPRGIHITIQASQSNPCVDLVSFLPHPPTPIRHLLGPITVVKDQATPWEVRLLSDNGRFSFRSPKTPSMPFGEFTLFATDTVREFHVNAHELVPGGGNLSWPLKRLPALEVLALSKMRLPRGSFSALAKEPVLCPPLKTLALFDCEMSTDVTRELEGILTKRELELFLLVSGGDHAQNAPMPDLWLIN